MVEKCVGKRIQQYRKSKGLTQDKLAEIIGVSPNYLSALERGVYNISLELLTKIINCLDCTPNDLFCDVINTGYKFRASHLSDMIENLPPEEQNRIFSVVDTLVKTYVKN